MTALIYIKLHSSWQDHRDSNPDGKLQRLLCYHYTIVQYKKLKYGGPTEIWTLNQLLKRQLLWPLSYESVLGGLFIPNATKTTPRFYTTRKMVGAWGFEPQTCRLRVESSTIELYSQSGPYFRLTRRLCYLTVRVNYFAIIRDDIIHNRLLSIMS